jgi:hypothetical protein
MEDGESYQEISEMLLSINDPELKLGITKRQVSRSIEIIKEASEKHACYNKRFSRVSARSLLN